MKISKLIALLEQRKEKLGEVEVVLYNYRTNDVQGVVGLVVLEDQYTNSTTVEVY